MNRLRKYGGIAALILALIVGVQVSVSFLVKTHRMRGYLIAHLERAFGRPVEASDFSVRVVPMPELHVDAVTIGEDPAFGHEYFLRAEHMTASLRWLGLLRGHFEFGTMSLTRPSLILVRNAGGRWNLEGWLPPAPSSVGGRAGAYGPQLPAESTHQLQKIEFDDGRINFKQGDEKWPFAFTGVTGSVEQVSPGRWELRLEAQPWRSGVALQSTGTVQVQGDVAGTSTRLQPAQIQVHWEKVSLADLFRLATGNDSGVRGQFALDGRASIGKAGPGAELGRSPWQYELQARVAQIHRWDLTEREDSPRFNLSLKGLWDVAAGGARAGELRVAVPRSNLHGVATLRTAGPSAWNVRVDSMAVQGTDLLAWYRAFQPGLAEDLSMEESMSGNLSMSGWPLRWEDGGMRGNAGALRVAGMGIAVRVEPFHGSLRNGKLSVEGVRMKLGAEGPVQKAGGESEKAGAKTRAGLNAENSIEGTLLHDFSAREGGLRLNVRIADAARVFALALAFGHTLNHGWEYTGGASGPIAWNWGQNPREARRSGSMDLLKGRLQVAGLNEPLKVEETRLEWRDGRRSATITKAEAFGAEWSGTIAETDAGTAGEQNQWRFQLHADHLDATELDRWVGPRGRPNWLQRLLPSLLGEASAPGRASELLREVSAEGELAVDSLTIEKVKLAKAHVKLALRDLHLRATDAEAQWSGGEIHGAVEATFSPSPKYELSAEVSHVSLAQLPWSEKWGERWSGTGAGNIHLTTGGVGREELLRELEGRGELKLNKVEFRGWDVETSLDSGVLRTGASRWASGEGEFGVGHRSLRLDAIRLNGVRGKTELSGTVGFGMDGNLSFVPVAAGKRAGKAAALPRELRVSGPLDAPLVMVEPVKVAGKKP